MTTLLPTEPEWGISSDLMDHEAANLATFEQVVPHWNNRDVPALLRHYDDEVVWHNIPMGETYHGQAEVGAFLGRLFGALPDLSLEVTARLPRGKYVAEEYVIRGTHRGSLFGVPPTGRSVEIRAMSIVEFRDGKLKEDHFYFDAAAVLRQLGLLPDLKRADSRSGRLALRIAVERGRLGRAAAVGALAMLTVEIASRRP